MALTMSLRPQAVDADHDHDSCVTVTPARPLTERQRMVLDFIRDSIASRGYPPTLREIGARMGIRSTNGVNDHIRALKRKGYLTRDGVAARGLRIIDRPAPSASMAAVHWTALEAVRLTCSACAADQVQMLNGDLTLRSQLPEVICHCCGVVGEMQKAQR